MASTRARRIQREIQDAQADKNAQIDIQVVRDNINHLKGTFPGPPDTPYEGGHYEVEIKIPSEYPFRPPKMRFETKVWHPNVSSQTGAICLDTLSTAWSPVLTIKSALMMLQSLLASPEPNDPQDAEVAKMLIKHPSEFKHKAREWAVQHANAPPKDEGQGSGGATPQQIRQARQAAKAKEAEIDISEYHGYNKDMIDRFCAMGFPVSAVVAGFEAFGIDKMDGEDYELEEAYIGDVTAYLFNEHQ